jgi:hypothetical protein
MLFIESIGQRPRTGFAPSAWLLLPGERSGSKTVSHGPASDQGGSDRNVMLHVQYLSHAVTRLDPHRQHGTPCSPLFCLSLVGRLQGHPNKVESMCVCTLGVCCGCVGSSLSLSLWVPVSVTPSVVQLVISSSTRPRLLAFVSFPPLFNYFRYTKQPCSFVLLSVEPDTFPSFFNSLFILQVVCSWFTYFL